MSDESAPRCPQQSDTGEHRSTQPIAELWAPAQIAARGAFREAMPKAGVRLLEPVMKVSLGQQTKP